MGWGVGEVLNHEGRENDGRHEKNVADGFNPWNGAGLDKLVRG